jgi:hypothetical protein
MAQGLIWSLYCPLPDVIFRIEALDQHSEISGTYFIAVSFENGVLKSSIQHSGIFSDLFIMSIPPTLKKQMEIHLGEMSV